MPPGTHDPWGVLLARLDPDVEIAGRARAAMKAERVRAHDQEPDVSCGERSQQIDKVRIHRFARRARAIVPGSVSRLAGCVGRRDGGPIFPIVRVGSRVRRKASHGHALPTFCCAILHGPIIP